MGVPEVGEDDGDALGEPVGSTDGDVEGEPLGVPVLGLLLGK